MTSDSRRPVEEEVDGAGRQQPGRQRPDGDEPEDRPRAGPRKVGEPQLHPAVEQQHGDGERHDREEGVAEDLVGVEPAQPRAHRQVRRQQQHDRGQADPPAQPLQADAEDDEPMRTISLLSTVLLAG